MSEQVIKSLEQCSTACNSINVGEKSHTVYWGEKAIEWGFCIMITFAVLALTEYTLTAVPTAQFTSPHHLTQAGEGKLPPGVLSAK